MSNESTEQLHEELFGHDHITVIEPHGNLFELKLRELWGYKDLILLFVRRDFVAEYKQTILGPAWHIIQPLMITIMFTIVFGNIAKLSTDGLPPFLFYMSGTVIWTYFANVFTEISGTFTKNAGIFGKVYFPRLAIPVSVMISKLIAFAIQFGIFLAFGAYYLMTTNVLVPNGWILFTPLLLLMMGSLALGGGIIISSLTTRYRDLMVLIGFGVQLLMYATPVIYPLSSLPEKWQFWAALNPIAPIIEAFRYAYLGAGTASWEMLSTSGATILAILLLGTLMFNRVERTFMDTV